MPSNIPDNWRDRTIEELNKKVRNSGICSSCGNKVNLSAEIVTPATYSGGTLQLGQVYPLASLVCSNCGKTTFFNLITLGIIAPESGEDGGDDDDE